jgi:hypothetical protein
MLPREQTILRLILADRLSAAHHYTGQNTGVESLTDGPGIVFSSLIAAHARAKLRQRRKGDQFPSA